MFTFIDQLMFLFAYDKIWLMQVFWLVCAFDFMLFLLFSTLAYMSICFFYWATLLQLSISVGFCVILFSMQLVSGDCRNCCLWHGNRQTWCAPHHSLRRSVIWSHFVIWLFYFCDCIIASSWSATLLWWWGFAPMTRKISKIWRWGAN